MPVFLQRFTQRPHNVEQKHYRFFVFSNYFYFFDMFAHGMAVLLNIFLGLTAVAVFNIFSVGVYALALYLNLRGRLNLSLTLLVAETIVYAFVQGFATGITLTDPVLLAVLMIVFFSSITDVKIKAGLGAMIGIAYIFLELYIRSQLRPIAMNSFGSWTTMLSATIVIALVFGYMAYYFSLSATVAEAALDKERLRSEILLRNILPGPIADRLKAAPETIADEFNDVTILFADIVGFTQMSANVNPVELVGMLNLVFSEFDELAQKHGLEKIKTIGDAYMAVGGLPEPSDNHCEAVVAFAIDMLDAIAKHTAWNGEKIRLRIGINTGPVVAGVIGRHKFSYDLWGDAVNTASRMESYGLEDAIQVTQAVKDRLHGKYQFERRGPVLIKGKGNMTTYILMNRVAEGAC